LVTGGSNAAQHRCVTHLYGGAKQQLLPHFVVQLVFTVAKEIVSKKLFLQHRDFYVKSSGCKKEACLFSNFIIKPLTPI
jgi:hypothetical protein